MLLIRMFTFRFKDEGYSLHHLYLATHTSDNLPNSILKVSIQLQNDITLKEGSEIGCVWFVA